MFHFAKIFREAAAANEDVAISWFLRGTQLMLQSARLTGKSRTSISSCAFPSSLHASVDLGSAVRREEGPDFGESAVSFFIDNFHYCHPAVGMTSSGKGWSAAHTPSAPSALCFPKALISITREQLDAWQLVYHSQKLSLRVIHADWGRSIVQQRCDELAQCHILLWQMLKWWLPAKRTSHTPRYWL